jgi:small-conductance mechanosensitive channel
MSRSTALRAQVSSNSNVTSPGNNTKSVLKWRPSLFNPVKALIVSLLGIFITNTDALNVVAKILSIIFYIYFVITVLGTVGVDTKAFLSLLSISGITLGLSVQTILGHTFNGIYLALFCPFKRGCIITVDNYTGKVISIDSRYVKLQMENKALILLPSYLVYAKPITVVEK